jgi:5'-nucleotidase
MGKRIYGESVREKLDRWGRKYYMIGGDDPGYAETQDSDFKAIANNFISITPLHLDWTNYASIATLSQRKI